MPSETLKILAVDDVPENLAALEGALDLPGIQLVQASGGIAALELLLADEFALALVDVQMPDMDGFQLAETMRSIERTRAVPIIFLTAVATDERRRFQGFEAGAVDYLFKPLDVRVLRSKVAVFVELARQRKELGRQRDELARALGRLRAHGDNSPLAVLELDSQLRIVTWAEGAQRLFGYPASAMLGTRMDDAPFLIPGKRSEFLSAMRELARGGDQREQQAHRFLRADGEAREGEWYCSSLAGKTTALSTLMLQVLDVTERRRAEETQRLLIGELNHRVKNSLATVQAIAGQSLRRADSLEQFSENFGGRLQALSSAHSLLSATTWESASLRRLIDDQLSIGTALEDRLVLDGDDVELAPELALRFALVLHELTTNAHKHGALASPSGRVEIRWQIERGRLDLSWTECGGRPPKADKVRGFGSDLIEGSLSSCGGQAEAHFAAEGARWNISLPLGETVTIYPEEESKMTPNDDPEFEVAPATDPICEAMRVLIVEDEPLVAMELTLQIEDYQMIPLGPAASCKQALDIIREERPDAVLLDGNLNGEKVDAVADELAEAGIPFAFVSGYASNSFPERHQHRPALGKPYTIPALQAVLAELAQGCESARGDRHGVA